MAFVCLDVRCLYIFLIGARFGCTSSSDMEIKVNPPQNFVIVDPGYLGYLYLQWQPPLALETSGECVVEYELKYRNIDSEKWKTIITRNLHYKDGFDLNQGIQAKIHTILSQKCTNGSEVQSSWVEATYWTSEKGSLETKIQDMDCVYYNWQVLFCSWKPGKIVYLETNYNLFYWYEGMDHALECMDYMKANGKNIGCRFPYLESPDYKDFFVRINGSSEAKPIRSSYFMFQLQNIVKPLPPDFLYMNMKNSVEINLKWSVPRGPIPAKCFIYEISFTEDDNYWMSTTFEDEMNLRRKSNESQKLCFLIRSKVNIYCSDDGIWSDWSEEQCWRDDIWKETLVFFVLPFAFLAILVLLVTCLVLNKQNTLLKVVFNPKKEVFSHQESTC